jgi:predicted metal-dependent peptidase
MRIKEGIARIEAGELSRETLEQIERDFLQMLELIKLFLISERDTYYGYFLMSMRFKAEFDGRAIAGIRLGEYPPLFVSNPLLLCTFELKEILYVVCHEIEHVALNHPAEMLKANPSGDQVLFRLFNLAADASVNDRLDFEAAHGSGFMKAPRNDIAEPVLPAR